MSLAVHFSVRIIIIFVNDAVFMFYVNSKLLIVDLLSRHRVRLLTVQYDINPVLSRQHFSLYVEIHYMVLDTMHIIIRIRYAMLSCILLYRVMLRNLVL